MSGRLSGKSALVTGAASGIGRAVAMRFAREGAVVAFVDRDPEGARAAIAELDNETNAYPFEADVTDEDEVARAFTGLQERAGTVDIAVANAGVQLFGQDAPAGDLDLAVWRKTLEINLTGAFLTVKHAVRAMVDHGGSLILTGSPTGIVGGGRGFTAYSASKAGIHGLARVMAADYAAAGIRVNVVVPGYTETPLVRSIAEDLDARSALLSTVPLGRAGTPQDVEGVMVFLASDESAFATGALFIVDGGATAV
jgi:NAD(P)-dependent dehydrogenase (short-subunit alcohol dehydrogenase family)